MSDDYSGNSSTSGSVIVGGSVTGNIEIVGDEDWFKVALQAGSTYLFDLSGAGSGGGTLGLGSGTPNLRLYAPDGSLQESSISGGLNGDPRLSFQPSATATYFLEVRALSDNATGTYKLSATPSTLADDHSGTKSTTESPRILRRLLRLRMEPR
jgi:hypothetical protein